MSSLLNNNQINTVLNTVYTEVTGQEVSTPITAYSITDKGNDVSNVLASREQFTKALINRLMYNLFTDAEYRGGLDDVFFVNSEQYGSIVQLISVTAPEVQESHAWKDFVSGTSKVGEYTVYLPIVDVEIYGKTVSWELPIAITDEQWDTAVSNAEELRTFINYVMLAVTNAVNIHLENLNMINRNNFIAEKIAYSESESAEGIHVINLVQKYHDEYNSSITTAKAFLKSAECMRYASKELGLFMDYLKKPTALFNTKGNVKFIPEDRFVCQILSDFKSNMDSVALSTTFNDKFVELPYHQAIPYWQSPVASVGEELTFDSVSAINVDIADDTTIEKSGIIAFMCDKWAIIHTLIKHRIASKVFEPEALTQYYYQFRDKYINNLGLNAVVFTVEDITVS